MSVVDTNVLVYATTAGAPFHNIARAALTRLVAQGRVSVSRQILREYLSAVTRPQTWAPSLPIAQALAETDRILRRFGLLEDSPAAWDQFVRLGRSISFGGRQVYDANIVATMLAYGETRLLTFDTGHFHRFAGQIEIVVP